MPLGQAAQAPGETAPWEEENCPTAQAVQAADAVAAMAME